ncbi:MAG: glycosyltransferase family 2 protein [Desulfovibrio sp.]|nr:glycosyltransferase family 2 protein [Desulfovibrio sp.]
MNAESAAPQRPDVSFVMPCYNEADVIPYTIPRFVRAFQREGFKLQLVACDNGSTDRTGELIEQLTREGLPITPVRVEVNQGYGFGVLFSLPSCTADWVGIIPADGQIDAEDAVRLYEIARTLKEPALIKVRRRFRLDGAHRSVTSFGYNVAMAALWPGIGSFDVNGSPKLLHRSTIEAMRLVSKDWLLDPEILVKAYQMGLKVIEVNAFSRMREHGSSHVRPMDVARFFRGLFKLRAGLIR